MECDEVMLTVRITAAERTLLRRLAQGHRSDVSEVVSDALLDIIPTLSAPGDAYRLLGALAVPAPCALTVWLPTPLADLLVPGAARIAQITDVRVESASAALGAALRLWLSQDPVRLATNLSVMHAGRPAALVAA
ncbi:hypothetical protein DR950_22660 [Kitasatospora xanthocidica]|uniref:Ribbon-helix-helix protein, CopG family n=2 Tax=Kitasatosporales TaxID=85011 RepID=A0A372ZXH8_9ACTN|nr:hypothetical protein AMK13_23850 [Streptomyces sp. CB02056]RGD60214.1 hypothetical protein DR950_22660 [Kitasatospora xanthocidica]